MNLELFSCSGGMAEGFRRAGIEFDLAFDADPNACDSYKANLGHRPVQMDVRDLLRMVQTGWRPCRTWRQPWPPSWSGDAVNQIDLLVADPPCTPWSRAGKRKGTEDERDMLGSTIELIHLLRPRVYVIGNVPGLDDSTNWPTVQCALEPLRAIGYCVADFMRLDAADYGVPQHRVRPFWFGHLAGPCLTPPAPTHGDPAFVGHGQLPGMDALKPWVTCRQALGHLSPEELGRPVRMKWKHGMHGPHHRPAMLDEPAATITRNTHSDGCLLMNTKHPINVLDQPSMTICTKGNMQGGQGASVLALAEPPPHRKRPPSTKGAQWSRVHSPDSPAPTVLTDIDRKTGNGVKLEWPWDRPATTVFAEARIPPPGHHGKLVGGIMSQPNAVLLSERAAKILQGLPETWVLAGKTKRSRWSMLGQLMPPPLAEAVACSVREQMGRGR